ncbi:site-specific DNA-methyltransferase [Brachybacterium saurashtrense]|uniref:Site-specific DNA-methyltransferase n=1 Tax=Brachybacterium saurashtrense TaxID=556288 RepID=A0ABN5MV06_9MICO|nr:site-specific DNA-methyltransferase [Brachybacterium saurashtrense]AXK47341.1 site-specific DNA-methyltransferase [Brachybacterium saurashtrense]
MLENGQRSRAAAAEKEAAVPKKPHGRLELTWMGKDLALIPHEDGKYDYAWVDPSDPRVTEVRTLEETATVGQAASLLDGDGHMTAAGSDDNLLIVGDSGDALRSLGTIPEYRNRYEGQVKLVYIDPPFNTGKVFSRYSDQMEHSVWLTFMRDRIRDIKPLMAPDASIWVHLDDEEVHRMRALLDEEFGAENFVSEVAWQKAVTPRNNVRERLSAAHDYILVYRIGSGWLPKRLDESSVTDRRYKSPDGDPMPWRDHPIDSPGAVTHQGMVYAIQHPITGRLMYTKQGRSWGHEQSWLLEQMSEYAPYELRDIDDAEERARICGISASEVRQGVKAIMLAVPLEEAAKMAQERYDAGNWPIIYLTRKGQGKSGIQAKAYPNTQKKSAATMWFASEVGANIAGKSEVGDLFPDIAPFDTPKPERLLERILHIGSNPGDLVLDCFAGSGTTAAVAQKMGRRWVTVELLEETVETFIVPRLTKVIDGSDQGGISTRTDRVPAEGVELPDGMTALQAQTFNSALTKAAADVELEIDVASETARLARAAKKAGGSELSDEELAALARLAAKLAKTSETSIDVYAKALAPLRAATKTRNETTVRWSGGGGFTIARLGPSMYDVEDGPEGRTEVYLSQAATNGAWSAAVAAQLGYRRTADHPVFAGVKGRERLAVIDGVADEAVVRDLHARLAPGETVTVVAKAALEDSAALLRELAPGSTLRVAPAGLLQKGAVIR